MLPSYQIITRVAKKSGRLLKNIILTNINFKKMFYNYEHFTLKRVSLLTIAVCCHILILYGSSPVHHLSKTTNFLGSLSCHKITTLWSEPLIVSGQWVANIGNFHVARASKKLWNSKDVLYSRVFEEGISIKIPPLFSPHLSQ